MSEDNNEDASENEKTQYNSRITNLLFDPQTQWMARKNYGGEIEDLNKTGWIAEGKIAFTKLTETKEIEEKVGSYIQSYQDLSGRLKTFKSSLRSKIVQSKQSVDSFNLEQIANFMPWVMSCQMLFEPIRTMLFCVHQNRDPSQFPIVYTTLPNEQINEVCNQAIFECVKYNSPSIQIAKAAFKKSNIGLITRMWERSVIYFEGLSKSIAETLGKLKKKAGEALNTVYESTFKPLFDAVSQVAKAGYQLFKLLNPKNYFNSETDYEQEIKKIDAQESNETKNYRGFISELIDEIFSNLRYYGDIVINYGYLEKAALKKSVSGRLFYYFPDKPNLMFTINQSFPEVYTIIQGELSKIPEKDFTIDFLRGVIKGDVLSLGGRMLKSIKIESEEPKKKTYLEKFGSNYLDWNEKIPTSSQYEEVRKRFKGIMFDKTIQKEENKNEQEQS